MRPLALLVAAAMLAGCAKALQGEGEESLVVRNADGVPLSLVLIITQVEGGLRIFGEEIFVDAGTSQAFDVQMRPGEHRVDITTSARASEVLRLDIPKKGDTTITVRVDRGGATLSVMN